MPPIIKNHERFTEAAIDDEIVVMRVDTGEFYEMSGTAAAAWRLIDGRRDRAALLAALAAEFAANGALITADVDEFLDQLRETGLVNIG